MYQLSHGINDTKQPLPALLHEFYGTPKALNYNELRNFRYFSLRLAMRLASIVDVGASAW